LTGTQLAVVKRGPNAGRDIEELAHRVEGVRALAVVDIEGVHIPGFNGVDLVRIAELALQRALHDGAAEVHVAVDTGA
jgi:hypothetical protein